MTQVSIAIRTRVNDKLIQCQAILKAKLHMDFSIPSIDYNLRGTTAGTARASKWHIQLHPVLLETHQDEMINETVPHEFAHLVTSQLYPNTKRTVFSKGRPHGTEWKHVMRLLGVKPERCHNMNVPTSISRGAKSTSVVVFCNVCAHEYTIGPVRIARLIAKPDSMWCCGRNSQLLFKSAAPVPTPATVSKPSTTSSKMDICHNLFVSNRNNSRADIIKLFIVSAQCTPAGASTYYATLKKKLG